MQCSAGQCEDFTASYCDFDALCYVVERAPSFKSLRLPDCIEVSITVCSMLISEKHFQSVCEACPCLKKLSLRFRGVICSGNHCYLKSIGIHDALIKCPIPRMHELRSLQLVYCGLTKKKLMAIVDSCPVLESLHISHCIGADC
ncbi:unnamed protein product [Urochloa humidicola]